jgi:hypothetical protein
VSIIIRSSAGDTIVTFDTKSPGDTPCEVSGSMKEALDLHLAKPFLQFVPELGRNVDHAPQCWSWVFDRVNDFLCDHREAEIIEAEPPELQMPEWDLPDGAVP